MEDFFIFCLGECYVADLAVDVGDEDFSDGHVEFGGTLFEFFMGEGVDEEADVAFRWVALVWHD